MAEPNYRVVNVFTETCLAGYVFAVFEDALGTHQVAVRTLCGLGLCVDETERILVPDLPVELGRGTETI